jgi:hypothetical protein
MTRNRILIPGVKACGKERLGFSVAKKHKCRFYESLQKGHYFTVLSNQIFLQQSLNLSKNLTLYREYFPAGM